MRLFEYMKEMLAGPGTLRFVVQPLVAALLGVLDGRRDALKGVERPYYRTAALPRTLRRIALSLATGMLMSLIFQYVIRKKVILAAAIGFGAIFIALPFIAARELSFRAWRLVLQRRAHAA